MTRTWVTTLSSLLLAGLLVSGCEKTDEGSDGGTTNTTNTTNSTNTTNPDAGAPPEGVTFKNAGEEVDAVFTGGDEIYLIVPYSVSDVSADAIDFTIKATGFGGSSGAMLRQPREPLRIRNPALWARWQRRLEVEAWTRNLREQAAKLPLRQKGPINHPTAACTASSECAATEVCHNLDCMSTLAIKTEKFSSTPTVDVEVKVKTDAVAILVDKNDTVSQTDLDALKDAFVNTIWPRDVALFGNPPLESGKPTLASDRNADGLIWLVLTSKVADKNAVGFFVATDFTDDAASNKADILFAVPPGGDNDATAIARTMAHELEHLLNYATNVYQKQVAGGQGTLAALWVDEGLGHFAEDACGYGGENTTLLDEQLLPSFGDTRMFEGDSANDTLAMRAMAMTYLRHMFERKGGVSYKAGGPAITDNGGAAWLAKLTSSDKQGVEAITDSYGDYKAAFDKWIAAISLDGRGVTDYAPYNFNDVVTDPVTGNPIGVVIRGKRKDFTGADVDLQGPLENAISAESTDETVVNSSAKFFLLQGQSGTVKVSVTSQEADFRFAVIKLK